MSIVNMTTIARSRKTIDRSTWRDNEERQIIDLLKQFCDDYYLDSSYDDVHFLADCESSKHCRQAWMMLMKAMNICIYRSIIFEFKCKSVCLLRQHFLFELSTRQDEKIIEDVRLVIVVVVVVIIVFRVARQGFISIYPSE
jgi:hypothetical protein